MLVVCAGVLEALEPGARGAGGPGAAELDALACVCAVVEFYVMEAPGGARSNALQQARVLRPLVNLFAGWGGLPGCHSLRRCESLVPAAACIWLPEGAAAMRTWQRYRSSLSTEHVQLCCSTVHHHSLFSS